MGTEKIIVNKMMISGTDKRIFNISMQSGCVVNGLVPDGKYLMYRAREEAKQYEDQFGIKIPGKLMAERVANTVQMNTIYSHKRPFGTSMIIAAGDNLKGASLWMVEPSGAVH